MCSALGHVRFTPESGMCIATSDVRYGPIADILDDFADIGLSGKHGDARQDDPDFGELTGLRIDLDGTAVLLDDDVMTD